MKTRINGVQGCETISLCIDSLKTYPFARCATGVIKLFQCSEDNGCQFFLFLGENTFRKWEYLYTFQIGTVSLAKNLA